VDLLLAPVEAPVMARAEEGDHAEDRDGQQSRGDGAAPVLAGAPGLARGHARAHGVEIDDGRADQQQYAHREVAEDPSEVAAEAGPAEQHHDEAQQREQDPDQAERREQRSQTLHDDLPFLTATAPTRRPPWSGPGRRRS
jgi:hypothetical protein